MAKPKLLDLFCGGGGAAMGYSHAGFDVTGIDISPQKKYPFKFIQADALMYAVAFGRQYDVIHASPPCQKYSSITPDKSIHRGMIGITRRVLQWIGKPYIIENVAGARHELYNPIMLCGTMFGLQTGGRQLRRHRYFEVVPQVLFERLVCKHNKNTVIGVYGHSGGSETRKGGTPRSSVKDWRKVMGIDWLPGSSLAQAIPPAYTEWLGRQMKGMICDGVSLI